MMICVLFFKLKNIIYHSKNYIFIIIFLSLTKSNPRDYIGFLKDEKRINVAFTHSKGAFYVIGNINCFKNKN